MENTCLYCYGITKEGADFHSACSQFFFGTKLAPQIPYSLDQMAELAKDVVKRSIAVAGVQAKLSMSLIKETLENKDNRFTVVGALGGNYIFKPPSGDFQELPENEHLTMRIAEAFGIKVVPSSLIRLKSGELSYITKRIDRGDKDNKIHMIDMFQITEASDKYISSIEKVGKTLKEHSDNTLLDQLFFFELVLFSFLTGNNDMHLKNFSMIESNSGWLLSPAYDLLNVAIVMPSDTDEFALSLEGKKKKFKKEHFERLADKLGLSQKQTLGVFNRFAKNKTTALNWIDKSFLSASKKKAYKKLVLERYERIYGEQGSASS